MSDAIETAIWSTCDEGTFSHGSNSQGIVGDMVKAIMTTIPDLIRERVKLLEDALVLLEQTVKEHDTADYGYGEENPWTMQEWFTKDDRETIAKARASLDLEGV